MEKIEKIYFETFGLLINIGDSILKLNPIISRKGFKFIKLTLKEFEKDFIELLGLPRNYASNIMFKLGNPEQLVTKEFYNAMSYRNYFNNIFTSELGFIYLLKSTKKGFFIKKGKYLNPTENSTGLSKMDRFTKDLVSQLRLLNPMYIDYQCIFNKSIKSNQIIGTLNRNVLKKFEESLYEIKDEDLKIISKLIRNPSLHKSCEIALESYELSLNINNPKVKFMILMMGLESLFNLGKDQIRHTLARHLSILLSDTKKQFQDNYKLFKKLYDIRSEIAHGTNPKRLGEEINELSEWTRLAINKVDKLKMTKEELFEFLNQKGFK